MKTILVTSGCGYIGSHKLADLVQNGFQVISADDHSHSTGELLAGVEKIKGVKVKNYKTNLCDLEAVKTIFRENNIDGIIHFAAFKSVDESVKEPLLYFQNNLTSLVNLLECTELFEVPYFVFSSSCSVYGDVEKMPVTEDTVLTEPKSPYGRTKKIGEEIISDFAKTSATKFILLRYFNPVGAHPSGIIGEVPYGAPSNLVQVIMQCAIGKIPVLNVYGHEYNTRDGSCIRDFSHVCYIATAHTLALKKTFNSPVAGNYTIYNLGTGNGVTVLEAIRAFETVTGMKVNYQLSAPRKGDVVAIYANNDKAKNDLSWEPVYNINEMMRTAWKWQTVLTGKSK